MYNTIKIGIRKTKQNLAPKMKNCYIWLDFGCMDQDGNPAGELKQLDMIMKISDCIFTPVVDHDWNQWNLGNYYYDIYKDYKAKLWSEGEFAYVNRGWCRVEMFYAANIPLFESKVERKEKFSGGLLHHLNNNRRAHLLYGTT